MSRQLSQTSIILSFLGQYVDQSFISRSDVPNVKPKEVFECSLGLDTSLTYDSPSTMVSNSDILNPTHAFSQTITVHNTKSFGIKNLKMITDNIPVFHGYPSIEITLISPSLTEVAPSYVAVANGVVAQWSDSYVNG